MTLSMPVKVVALSALALAFGLGGLLMLMGHKSSGPEVVVAPTHHAAVVSLKPTAFKVKPKVAVKPKPKVQLFANLPAGLRRGLLKHPEVVAVVYASNIPGDRATAAAARAAARTAHVGFVALDVRDNATANAVALWTSNTATPTVYVVRRPGGSAEYTFGGSADRDTMTAAARAAK